MADQHGSDEGVWGLVVVSSGPEEAARVASEPELVLWLMSAVVVKLRLWRSSTKSLSHNSILHGDREGGVREECACVCVSIGRRKGSKRGGFEGWVMWNFTFAGNLGNGWVGFL
jgi:hypothetical protein